MHGTKRISEVPARPFSQPSKSVAASFRLALRIALRDLRGGLRGFGIFIACLALGVMTIAAVSS
jgi:putative ABC transport system permease protein